MYSIPAWAFIVVLIGITLPTRAEWQPFEPLPDGCGKMVEVKVDAAVHTRTNRVHVISVPMNQRYGFVVRPHLDDRWYAGGNEYRSTGNGFEEINVGCNVPMTGPVAIERAALVGSLWNPYSPATLELTCHRGKKLSEAHGSIRFRVYLFSTSSAAEAYAESINSAFERGKQEAAAADPTAENKETDPKPFSETVVANLDHLPQNTFLRRRATISGLVVQDTNAGMVGSRMEILAIVSPHAGDGYGRLMRSVGSDMTTSFEEALRTVRVDHPRWETGEVQVSFSDKYTPKDGGSAGAAFAVLVSSLLEGFEIDPQFAMTGDITVDGKVRAVGAVGSKIRGAMLDGMKIVAVPTENADLVTDYAVLEGVESLTKAQVIAVDTVEQTKAIARVDREGDVAEAMGLFATLTADATPWRPTPDRLATLEKIVELHPNHLSAQLLLKAGRNQLPRTLTAATSLDEAFMAIRPLAPEGLEEKLREKTLDRQVVADLKVRLRKVSLISHAKARPMVEALIAYVSQVEAASRRTLSNDAVERINRTLRDIARESESLGADRELIEDVMR